MEQKNEKVNEFEKGLILCGDLATGKSLIVNFFAGALPNQVYQLNGRTINLFEDTFVFRGLTPDHKFIHIDDVVDLNTIDATISILRSQKIEVRVPGKWAHEINTPRIIITTNLPFEQLLYFPTIYRRYHLVEVAKCGYSHLAKSE